MTTSGWTPLRRLSLEKLREGVETFNKWRKDSRSQIPLILSGAALGNRKLAGVDLSYVLLKRADLNHADLSGANLEGADLHGASLLNVSMPGAILRKANLAAANVNGDLRGVDLTGARLHGTQIYGSLLTGAEFRGARCQSTMFAAVDLSHCKNLVEVRHEGPSTIGIDTIYFSNGRIPKMFLRRAGVPRPLIADIKSMMQAVSPIKFYSCFISYSQVDADFARQLESELNKSNIRCWRDEKQVRAGDDIRPRSIAAFTRGTKSCCAARNGR